MPALLDLFGGRQSARTLHTIGTVALVLFVVVHVLEVAAAGFFVKVRSMVWQGSGGSSDPPGEVRQ
jgi:thiosulfate reductase cytochrome b subunit